MSDELRDRIKGIIDVHDEKFFDGDYPTTLAQAITDDLGLTVEEGHITGQGYGLPGVIGKRIVGKWEKG